MILIEVVKAKEALQRLTARRFSSYRVLRELVKLRKTVDAETEFYTEAEKKAVELYSETDEHGSPVFLADGRLKLKDVQAKKDFEAEILKLNETPVDGITPVYIREDDFKSIDDLPTPEEMLLLEGLVVFED